MTYEELLQAAHPYIMGAGLHQFQYKAVVVALHSPMVRLSGWSVFIRLLTLDTNTRYLEDSQASSSMDISSGASIASSSNHSRSARSIGKSSPFNSVLLRSRKSMNWYICLPSSWVRKWRLGLTFEGTETNIQ